MKKNPRIAIVGAGISGLSTAHYLYKELTDNDLEPAIQILEKQEFAGGVIRSHKIDGLLLESGPEGWASYKPAAKALIAELGLEQQVLGSNDDKRKTYIVNRRSLRPLPNGMAFFAPVDPISFWRSAPISVRGKFRASLEPFISRSKGDLSVQQFFERRLGSEFTEQLVEPLISAILGSDFEQVSALSALPELHRIEQRTGSLWKGLRKFAKMTSKVSVLHTMRNGMGDLIDQLERSLPPSTLRTGVGDLMLHHQNGHFRLAGREFEDAFDQVIFCTPAHATARILEKSLPEVAGLLGQIPYSSSRLVYLAYKRSDFSHPLDGFGFIVPHKEAGVIDACTWVSTKFDNRCGEDRVLLRCASHSARGDRSRLSADDLAHEVHLEIRELMGISCSPVMRKVFDVTDALPQMMVGHTERLQSVQEILTRHPGVIVSGSYTGGVGVPDCIRKGQETAVRVANRLSGRRDK